jgi:hypothetical protein
MTEPRDLDTRIVHRNIQKGRLSEEEYQAKLEALPDLEADAEFVDYEQRFEEEAEHEGGPPAPVFVEASPPSAPSFAAAPPPVSAEPTPPESAPAAAGPEHEAASDEPEPGGPRPGGFGTGTGWGSGGAPGGFGGSSF